LSSVDKTDTETDFLTMRDGMRS